MTIPNQPDEPGTAPAPLPPAIVSAILRDPGSPLYPSQIGVFCDDCGTEVSGDYMVSTEQTSAERLEVARAHLRTQGWVCTAAGDFCPACAASHPGEPRLFHLQRDHDVSGVSGTGRVANGVLWPDGTVSLRWIGERPSTVHWDRLADAEHVHGHGGATRIVWADEQPPVDRAAVLREAIDVAREEGHRLEAEVGIQAARGARTVAYLLRQRLVKDEQPEPTELKAAQQAQDAVLRIVAEVTTEANDVGGVDINDLVTRLQQAGYQLPDDES